jgi:hypothetical protein
MTFCQIASGFLFFGFRDNNISTEQGLPHCTRRTRSQSEVGPVIALGTEYPFRHCSSVDVIST